MRQISIKGSTSIKLAFALTAIAALAACGGGSDAPVAVAVDSPAVTIKPATAAAAASNLGLLAGTTISLPALTSTNGVALAAGTTLTLSAKPAGAEAGALAGFKLTSPGKVEEGTLVAGSCIFRVTSLNGQKTNPYDITFNPCSIDVQSGGVVANGSQQNVAVVFSFSGVPVTQTITVTTSVVNGNVVLTTSSGDTLSVGVATGASS